MLFRHCSREFQLDASASDEVCQETWIELANRMTRFVYDSKQRFHGRDWQMCYLKAIDFLRSFNAALRRFSMSVMNL